LTFLSPPNPQPLHLSNFFPSFFCPTSLVPLFLIHGYGEEARKTCKAKCVKSRYIAPVHFPSFFVFSPVRPALRPLSSFPYSAPTPLLLFFRAWFSVLIPPLPRRNAENVKVFAVPPPSSAFLSPSHICGRRRFSRRRLLPFPYALRPTLSFV